MSRSQFVLGVLCGAIAVISVSQFNLFTRSEAAPVFSSEGNTATDPLLYELRTYTAPEGKLDALNARFRNHTLALFEKHGMKNVMYWTATDKPNTLIYVIAHRDADAAKASWAAFREDPVWKKVAEETQRDGKIVEKVESVFMKATDYSPHHAVSAQ
ncbi:MAG: NIPSNAP family protein [Planctomyces sp.]